MRVVSSIWILSTVGACAFASADAPHPSATAAPSDSYVLDADGECNQWRAANDVDYQECLEKQRHAEQMASEAATRRTVVWAAAEQAGVAREATGSAMIGDGRNTGQGWWCFSGTYEGKQPFGRCFRSMNQCASRLVTRIEDGMEAEAPQCSQQDSATCFTMTNRETGDVKHFCFPAASMCTPQERAASSPETQDTKACAMYQ